MVQNSSWVLQIEEVSDIRPSNNPVRFLFSLPWMLTRQSAVFALLLTWTRRPKTRLWSGWMQPSALGHVARINFRAITLLRFYVAAKPSEALKKPCIQTVWLPRSGRLHFSAGNGGSSSFIGLKTGWKLNSQGVVCHSSELLVVVARTL